MGKARSNSKTDTLVTKIVNRGKLIKELKPYLEKDLDGLGLDELDIDILIDECTINNTLDNLPKDVKNKYKIKPYVRYYEITDELRAEALDYVNSIADIFESKPKEEDEWKPRKFTKTNRKGEEKDDTFFCHVLCNHRETCRHIKKYDDLKKEKETEDDDLF